MQQQEEQQVEAVRMMDMSCGHTHAVHLCLDAVATAKAVQAALEATTTTTVLAPAAVAAPHVHGAPHITATVGA